MRKDELLREHDAHERPQRIEHLREVESPHGGLLVAQREDVWIAGRLEDGASACDDEDADDVRPEALHDAGRHVEQCAQTVDRESGEDADPVAGPLDQQRRKERYHRIRAVERYLDVTRCRLASHEYPLERRHQVVRHVVEHSPQREAARKHREDRDVSAGNDRDLWFLGHIFPFFARVSP